MKSCPTCNRTFEDTFTFCLVDGSILSAPFDSQATKRTSNANNTNPPPTEVMPSHSLPDSAALPPTVIEPPMRYKVPITASSVVQQGEQKLRKTSKIKRAFKQTFWSAFAGMVVGLIIGVIHNDNYYWDRTGIRIDHIAEAAFTGIFFGILGVIFGYIIWAGIKFRKKN